DRVPAVGVGDSRVTVVQALDGGGQADRPVGSREAVIGRPLGRGDEVHRLLVHEDQGIRLDDGREGAGVRDRNGRVAQIAQGHVHLQGPVGARGERARGGGGAPDEAVVGRVVLTEHVAHHTGRIGCRFRGVGRGGEAAVGVPLRAGPYDPIVGAEAPGGGNGREVLERDRRDQRLSV